MKSPLALVCPLLGFALFIWLMVRVIGALRHSGATRQLSRRPNLTTSIADDGFWISSDQTDALAVIQYAYWTGTLRKTGRVPFQPGADGRQFVYTGAKPDRVSAALALAEDDADDRGFARPLTDPPILPPTDPDPSPTHGFPSAY